MLALPDPYDPNQNAPYGMRETSLYDGKYYLYFGPAPALSLHLPLRLLMGTPIRDAYAVMIFGAGSFLVSVLILLRFRTVLKVFDYYPLVLAVIAVGLNNYFGHFLRRPEVFEVALSSAFFWLLVAVYFLVTYFAQGARRERYLAFAGLALGLAIGSRYSYALCTPMLLLPAIYCLREAGWRMHGVYLPLVRRLLAGFLPWGCIVVRWTPSVGQRIG